MDQPVRNQTIFVNFSITFAKKWIVKIIIGKLMLSFMMITWNHIKEFGHSTTLAKTMVKWLGLLVVTAFSPAYAQIDTTHTVDYLVKEVLVGNGVLIGDVKFTGQRSAIGIYADSSDIFGIREGIILTSGNAYYALGPNKMPYSGWISNTPGDVQLDKIARGKTYDASVLEFEFITASENLSFEFVFASEEYLEYVGSKYNDVFAFFIEGPGVNYQNIARLPDKKTPITVNTVNHENNKAYYIDNEHINVKDAYVWDVRNRKVIPNKNFLKAEKPAPYYTQFDGFTTLLTASCRVVPNEIYKIKIAIADVGDRILDSGVFLKGGSFRSYGKEYVELNNHFNKGLERAKIDRIEPEIISSASNKAYELRKITDPGRIEFNFDKYDLSGHAIYTIMQFYKRWEANPDQAILIYGHTDNWGSNDYNYRLAEKRAQAVANELLRLGVPPDKLVLLAKGEMEPVHTNTTSFGRARNRRVELRLQMLQS